MEYKYYYNNVPGKGLCRNNLVYTSLMSEDQKTFVQWYYNDTEYHKRQNQVVDPTKMNEKWSRELCYLTHMSLYAPECIPKILDINLIDKKIYLEIDGPDFWEQAECDYRNFDKVLPNWQEQMLGIIQTHRKLGLWKYSMHPSSYFVVNGKLKSINYFFTYSQGENLISIKEVESHIYSSRQDEMRKHIENLGIEWDIPQSFEILNQLCWESFRANYPADFIERAKCIK